MGTRAFVEFPTYDYYIEFGEPLHNVYGESKGSIYVYTAYDGDKLPIDLHVAIKATLAHYHGETLATLDPERVAAELVRVLFEDSKWASVRIMAHQPSEGFHLWVDFKSEKVIYVGRDADKNQGVFKLGEWVEHEWAPPFTYDEEDYF